LGPAQDIRRRLEEVPRQHRRRHHRTGDVDEYTSSFDLVISTIPLWTICENPKEHRFNSVPILVKKEVEARRCPIENWVSYNGT
jgi:hypothetical protein